MPAALSSTGAVCQAQPEIGLRIAEFHCFERLGRRILFNMETLLAYEADAAAFDLALALLDKDDWQDQQTELVAKHGEDSLTIAAAFLRNEGFLTEAPPPHPTSPPRHLPPITTLELMLTHACNLRCAYCYGWEADSPHLYGADLAGMGIELAKQGLDFLFAASGRASRVTAVFFGGEPLMALDVLAAAAAHGRALEKESGKRLDLTLSTNATLLDARARQVLKKYRIGCQVSLDGPPEVHNACRRTPDGRGTYDLAVANVRPLTAMRPRRVPARATLAAGHSDVPAVVKHLLALGFGSVHVEPAAGCGPVSVTAADVPAIQQANERLAADLVAAAHSGRAVNYENLTRHLRATRLIERRNQHGCGAGRGLLALAQDGGIYPCHRFVGQKEFLLGDLINGPSAHLRKRYTAMTVDLRPICQDCWARHLCGGGCLHQAFTASGRIEIPNEKVSCAITRHLIECALAMHCELGLNEGRLPGESEEEDHDANT